MVIKKKRISNKFLQRIRKEGIFNKINFIFLFGSVSFGTDTPISDIDLCISLPTLRRKERGKARLKLLSKFEERYDIQVFEDLPLYIQKKVFKGDLIYCKNEEAVINIAIQKIYEFEEFEPYYNFYVNRDKGKV
jgi:uncharacterized protein